MNNKIAVQRYAKSLKMKALRSIHTYFLSNFGHKNSKKQADTLYRFMATKKFFTKWIQEWEVNLTYKHKIQKSLDRINYRMKMNMFVEWQAISLAHQLYLVQKSTSDKFYQSQISKKAFLSFKFFAIFVKK